MPNGEVRICDDGVWEYRHIRPGYQRAEGYEPCDLAVTVGRQAPMFHGSKWLSEADLDVSRYVCGPQAEELTTLLPIEDLAAAILQFMQNYGLYGKLRA